MKGIMLKELNIENEQKYHIVIRFRIKSYYYIHFYNLKLLRKYNNYLTIHYQKKNIFRRQESYPMVRRLILSLRSVTLMQKKLS